MKIDHYNADNVDTYLQSLAQDVSYVRRQIEDMNYGLAADNLAELSERLPFDAGPHWVMPHDFPERHTFEA